MRSSISTHVNQLIAPIIYTNSHCSAVLLLAILKALYVSIPISIYLVTVEYTQGA